MIYVISNRPVIDEWTIASELQSRSAANYRYWFRGQFALQVNIMTIFHQYRYAFNNHNAKLTERDIVINVTMNLNS